MLAYLRRVSKLVWERLQKRQRESLQREKQKAAQLSLNFQSSLHTVNNKEAIPLTGAVTVVLVTSWQTAGLV